MTAGWHGYPPWTDEKRDRLRKLHADGLSQKAIARAMGVSRHAVSSQCARLGLSRGVNPVKAAPAEPRPERPKPIPAGVPTLPPLPSLRGS